MKLRKPQEYATLRRRWGETKDIKQIHLWFRGSAHVKDPRRSQNVIRKSATRLVVPRVPLFCSYQICFFSCDLLLNRRTPKWNRFIELKLSCCARGNKPEVKWCLCMPFPLRWYFCVASKVDIGQVGSVGLVSTKSGLAFPISYHLAYSVDNSTWYDYQENGSRKVFRI